MQGMALVTGATLVIDARRMEAGAFFVEGGRRKPFLISHIKSDNKSTVMTALLMTGVPTFPLSWVCFHPFISINTYDQSSSNNNLCVLIRDREVDNIPL